MVDELLSTFQSAQIDFCRVPEIVGTQKGFGDVK